MDVSICIGNCCSISRRCARVAGFGKLSRSKSLAGGDRGVTTWNLSGTDPNTRSKARPANVQWWLMRRYAMGTLFMNCRLPLKAILSRSFETSMARTGCQVAVIGAGPYGLAAVSHLRAAGIETRVFGRALEFWKNNMPAGMLLRSPWAASHISDPSGRLTLDRYHALHGASPVRPISLERFIDYGVWFQGRVAPDLDERQVVRVETSNGSFRLCLEDGEVLHSQRVVVAT